MTPVDVAYSAASGNAIAGGMLAPSSYGPLGDAIAAMSPNTLSELLGTNVNVLMTAGCPDGDTAAFETNTAGQCITPWSGKGWFSAARRMIGMSGTAQGYSSEPTPGAHNKRVLWNLITNLFAQLFNPFSGAGAGHMYDGNVSISLNNIVYRRGYNDPRIWAENLLTGTRYLEYTSALTGQTAAIDVLPNMGTQGSIVQIGETGRVYTYDVATKVETFRGTMTGTDSYPVCIYVPGGDHIVLGGGATGTSLYTMNNTATISAISQTMPTGMKVAADSTQGPAVAHPNGHDSILVFSAVNNLAYEMNISTGAWTSLGSLGGQIVGGGESLVCGVAVHGTGGVVLFKAGGRTSAPVVQQCKILLFKV